LSPETLEKSDSQIRWQLLASDGSHSEDKDRKGRHQNISATSKHYGNSQTVPSNNLFAVVVEGSEHSYRKVDGRNIAARTLPIAPETTLISRQKIVSSNLAVVTFALFLVSVEEAILSASIPLQSLCIRWT